MYKKTLFTGIAAAGLMALGASAAHATISYDQDVTPDIIFGDGNANGGFTVDRSNGIELGLRGKLRFNASNLPEDTFNSNHDGTYSFDTGSPSGGAGWVSSTTPVWNFEWSINTDYDDSTGFDLDDLVYRLDLDFDAGAGTTFQSFDPINSVVCADHGLGNNTTGNGAGTEVGCGGAGLAYGGLIAISNVAQNSWSMEFFNDSPFNTFDPNVDGTYTFMLTALDDKGGQLAQTSIDIIVGAGASAVPEPATLGLMGLGLAGIGLSAARRRKRS